jgi:hypothetical protein
MASFAVPGSALDTAAAPDLRPAVSGTVSRWLLPNLAAAVFAVTLLQVLVVSGGGHTLFRDSDTGWHIRTGQRILDSRTIPTADPFSFTRAGREWFAWEWLSDIALGGVERAAGLPGVALLSAVLIALSLAGSTALGLRLGANFFSAAAGAALLLGVTSLHWLARPHLFSWLLALAFLAIAQTRRALWLLPVLSVVWANAHGSFLLGPMILCVYMMWRWSLMSLLATFVNPYGWQLHQHVIAYLRDSYLMDHIAEFRSFDFHTSGAIFVELFLLVAIAGGLVAAKHRDWPAVALTIVLLHGALLSARHMPLAALILLPLALSQLSREKRWVYTDNLRKFDRRIVGAIPAMIAVALAAIPAQHAAFDPSTFPVAAAGYLTPGARVFARDQWGGYLIYRFKGALPVFIDGRSDFYGNDYLERYATLADVRPGWEGILDTEHVTHVMLPPDQALAQALRLRPGWKVARADSVAVIFERVKS